MDPAAQWFTDIINRFLNIVVWPLFVGITVAMFIWAGLLFIMARGEPSKVEQARKAVIWAVIGVIVALVAFSAVTTIRQFIGSVPGDGSGLPGGDVEGCGQGTGEGCPL